MFLNTCTGVHISTTNLGKKFTERFVWKLPLDQESIWKMLHSSQPACTSSALPTSESTKAVIRITYIAFQKPYLTWTGMFVASSFCSAQSFSKSNCPSHTGQTSSIPLKACYFPWAQIYLFIYFYYTFFSYHLKQKSVICCTVFSLFVTTRLQPREHITQWRLNFCRVAQVWRH